MKKIIAVVLLMVTLFSLTSCAAISNLINPELERKYSKVLEMTQFLYVVDGYNILNKIPYHFIELEELLDEFPPLYKDIAEIKDECKYLKMYFKALFNDNLSYSERHDVAMKLLKLGNYNNWNLERAIFHYMSDQTILQVVLFGEWSNDHYFLYFGEQNEGNIWIRYNLPTDERKDEKYYYYIDNRAIGFCLKSNETSKFLSFRIVDISYNQVKIYCIFNGEYYTLSNNSI